MTEQQEQYENQSIDIQCDISEILEFNNFSLEDKIQFFGKCKNQPQQIKTHTETVQEYIYTEERFEMHGNLCFNNLLDCKFLNIKLLNLTKCELNILPEQINQMINLQKINLSQNYFKELPQFIENFKYLQVLDLSFNQIIRFDLNVKNLKLLNLSNNMLETPCLNQLDILCLQMNPIKILPKEFLKVVQQLKMFEFDWFKYCKPILPMKINFLQFPSLQKKMINALKYRGLCFADFIDLMSFGENDFQVSDFKGRNLFCLAGLNDEIGVLYGLNQIIPDDVNEKDFDNNTPLTVCYMENKMRSVDILKQFGAKFSFKVIHSICQNGDLENLQYLMNIKSDSNSVYNSINYESLLMLEDFDGNTPLHKLMMNFNNNEFSKEIALILIKYCVDLNIENYDGFTPLDISVKKHQLEAIKFAYWFNQSDYCDQTTGRYFNFNYQSKLTGHNICHTAVITGNLKILEYLQEINFDFFQVSKKNKLPKHLAIQSLSHVKNIRKIEKLWLYNNIIKTKIDLVEESSVVDKRSVQQLKKQIERSNAQRKQNFIQKLLDSESLSEEYLFDGEIDFNVDQENKQSTDETNTPLNIQRHLIKMNQQQTQKTEFSNFIDMIDYHPEIIKNLRNSNLSLAIDTIKTALVYYDIPVSERLKYKNQIQLLISKFKLNQVELKALMSNGVQLILNEYQFKIQNDERKKYLKELTQLLRDENLAEQEKAELCIRNQQYYCSQFNQKQELLKIDPLSTKDSKKLNSKLMETQQFNIIRLFQSQNQISEYLQANYSNSEKKLNKTIFFNLQNYEYLQQMKFKKRKVYLKIEYDNSQNIVEGQIMSPNSHQENLKIKISLQPTQQKYSC